MIDAPTIPCRKCQGTGKSRKDEQCQRCRGFGVYPPSGDRYLLNLPKVNT